jgi:ribulose-phosphate 3-epimerase
MVLKPEEVIEDWIAVGAKRLVVHIESTEKMSEIIAIMRKRFGNMKKSKEETSVFDVELSVALNVATPVSAITEYLEDVAGVQFMGIQTIGKQGEPFAEEVIEKIRNFHNAHPEIEISVDGGVSYELVPILKEVGVTRFVSGSTIFSRGEASVGDSISHFKKLLHNS